MTATHCLKRVSLFALILVTMSIISMASAAATSTQETSSISTSRIPLSSFDYGILSGERAVLGPQRMLVILVEFSDIRHTRTPEAIKRVALDQMNAYYTEVSYGKMSITGDVYGWYAVNRPMSFYGRDSRNPGDDDNVQALARDAVALLPSSLDLRSFDFLIVVHAGADQAAAQGDQLSDLIWSVCYCATFPDYQGSEPIRVRSKSFEQYTFLSEQDALGVFAHETGHLFGLPDFYDYEKDNHYYVGYWSLMDVGNYCCTRGSQSTPSYIGGWGAALLGWLKPTLADKAAALSSFILTPLESPQATTVLIPVSRNTYYFTEYRTKVGRDSNLPSSGILVYFVDERLESGKGILKMVDPRTGKPMPSTSDILELNRAVFRDGDKLQDATNHVYLYLSVTALPTLLYSAEQLTGRVLRTTLTTGGSITASYGEMIQASATLVDENGRALPGQNLQVEILTAGEWQVLTSGTTDQNGKVSFQLSLRYDVGRYSLRFTYLGGKAGDMWYVAYSKQADLQITPASLSISVSVPSTLIGDSLSVEISVVSQQGQPLADIPLSITLDGEAKGSVTTDSNGKAILVLPVGMGAHSIAVTSASTNYVRTSSSATVNVIPSLVVGGVAGAVGVAVLAVVIILRSKKRQTA